MPKFAKIFFEKKDGTITDQSINSDLLGKLVGRDCVKQGSLKYGAVWNNEGELVWEYHSPAYEAFLLCLSKKKTEKLPEGEIKQKLSELHAKNPALFDKYLDFLVEKKRKILLDSTENLP